MSFEPIKKIGMLTIIALLTLTNSHAILQTPMRGILVNRTEVTDSRIGDAKRSGANTIVLMVDPADKAPSTEATRVRRAGLRLYYWIEIGRCPELADAHPEWMA